MNLFDHLVSIAIESYFWRHYENLEYQNIKIRLETFEWTWKHHNDSDIILSTENALFRQNDISK